MSSQIESTPNPLSLVIQEQAPSHNKKIAYCILAEYTEYIFKRNGKAFDATITANESADD